MELMTPAHSALPYDAGVCSPSPSAFSSRAQGASTSAVHLRTAPSHVSRGGGVTLTEFLGSVHWLMRKLLYWTRPLMLLDEK